MSSKFHFLKFWKKIGAVVGESRNGFGNFIEVDLSWIYTCVKFHLDFSVRFGMENLMYPFWQNFENLDFTELKWIIYQGMRVKISNSKILEFLGNLKIDKRTNVERLSLRESLIVKWEIKIEKLKRRSWFISTGECENWRNCEYCGISNGQTIPKFANFFSQILVFQIEKILIIC